MATLKLASELQLLVVGSVAMLTEYIFDKQAWYVGTVGRCC